MGYQKSLKMGGGPREPATGPHGWALPKPKHLAPKS